MREGRGFVAGFLTAVLAMSLVVGAQATVGKKTMTADYNNIKIELDGQQITPTDANGKAVEPFAVDGTTYLPVRAVSEALGVDVEWDGNTNTVLLTSAYDNTADLLGFYKILEQSFDDLQTHFDGILNGSVQEVINTTLSSGPYEGMTFFESAKKLMETTLYNVESHYNACKPYLSDSDISLVSEYKRLNSLLLSQFENIHNGNTANMNNIIGISTQAYVDCMSNSMSANTGFWETYQNSF
ncbi:copper amine oxidase N-terminal domain-containing protein [Candidatus Allofournierella merdipullorum]|uniref:copper amine oxidase N-terminal domain-containing protein n=1 Tax=Candidatus Allofournierella merdipullorum TaxID=2838595 RepID=UPI00374FD1BC